MSLFFFICRSAAQKNQVLQPKMSLLQLEMKSFLSVQIKLHAVIQTGENQTGCKQANSLL